MIYCEPFEPRSAREWTNNKESQCFRLGSTRGGSHRQVFFRKNASAILIMSPAELASVAMICYCAFERNEHPKKSVGSGLAEVFESLRRRKLMSKVFRLDAIGPNMRAYIDE